jgi:hypothetical protein
MPYCSKERRLAERGGSWVEKVKRVRRWEREQNNVRKLQLSL